MRDVIAADVLWTLVPALGDLSPHLRNALFDAAMTQYRSTQQAQGLDKLIPCFAHLTRDQRDTLFDVALNDQPEVAVELLAAQWQHLSPGQRERLLDAALRLAEDPKDGFLVLAGLGPVLGHMDPMQQEAVVNAAAALPGPECLIAIEGMAAGMAGLKTSLRNRLVAVVHAELEAPQTSHEAARAIRALLPALACLDPQQQATLVTAGLALPDERGRSSMVASLFAVSLHLDESHQAWLLPQLVDAALQMLPGGLKDHSKSLCPVLASAFGHLDAIQRSVLLAAAGKFVNLFPQGNDYAQQPQYGAILVAARNLPSLTPPERDELVAAVVRLAGPPIQMQKGMLAEVLVALAEGVEKLKQARSSQSDSRG